MTDAKKKNFFNLNPSTDWLRHTGLRLCSDGARAAWMDLECLMHEASDYGYLVINDEPATDEQLSILTGMPLERLQGYMAELEKNGVLLRNRNRVIYSRRLIDKQKKSATATKNGNKGGNPNLGNYRDNSEPDNPRDNPRDNLKSESKKVIKEKKQVKKESPPEEGGLWFEGQHIRLGRGEYDRLRAMSGMEDGAFWRLLIGRDEFYQRTPQQAVKWYQQTIEYIENNRAE